MLIAMHVDDAHRCERDKERERGMESLWGFSRSFISLSAMVSHVGLCMCT